MKKQYKFLILFSVIMIIAIVIIVIINQPKTFTLVLTPQNVLNYKKEGNKEFFEHVEFRQLKEDNQYDIVWENGQIIKSKLFYNDGWYYYDKNDIISIDQNFVALAQSNMVEMIPFTIDRFDSTTKDNLNNYLNEKQINNYGELTTEEKIRLDIDNDGDQETIYISSNVFSMENRDKDFSLIVLEYRGQSKILYEKQDSVDKFESMCAPYLAAVIDINKDDKLEVILGCAYFDLLGTDYSIFRLEDGDVKILKDF